MHGFAYDPIHDEIIVSSPLTQGILVFRGAANGEEAPIRIIQGPHTRIVGTAEGGNDKVSVDGVNNEILLPVGTGTSRENRNPVAENGVLVFARDANGDIAPKRILAGPDTQIRGVNAVAADPVHDRLIVNSGGALLIFARTASGNTNRADYTRDHFVRLAVGAGWLLAALLGEVAGQEALLFSAA